MTTPRMLATLALTTAVAAQDGPTTELGRIEWQRDYRAATAAAKAAKKPLLLLFQEVPG